MIEASLPNPCIIAIASLSIGRAACPNPSIIAMTLVARMIFLRDWLVAIRPLAWKDLTGIVLISGPSRGVALGHVFAL
jgi:hypothetical protein